MSDAPMSGGDYYTLIASLPALPPTFEVDRCPITWPRLEQRLQMLHDRDAAMLTRLIDFLAWDRQPLQRTDEEVNRHYAALMSQSLHPVVRAVVDQRINMRTIISALRRRRLGWGPPEGVGDLADPIRRRWMHPQFGLQTRYPWIASLDELLASGDAAAAERLILSISWRTWSRAASIHYFTFAAVLLYVARWGIVNRWVTQDAVAGRSRFEASLATLVSSHDNFNG